MKENTIVPNMQTELYLAYPVFFENGTVDYFIKEPIVAWFFFNDSLSSFPLTGIQHLDKIISGGVIIFNIKTNHWIISSSNDKSITGDSEFKLKNYFDNNAKNNG